MILRDFSLSWVDSKVDVVLCIFVMLPAVSFVICGGVVKVGNDSFSTKKITNT